jgi:3-methyladenine DNA glycosylase AlkD
VTAKPEAAAQADRTPSPAPAVLAEQILGELRAQANPDSVAGMARYGIATEGALGVSMPVLRSIAKRVRPLRRTDPGYLHELAAALWASSVHEARILAGLVDVPELVTREQMEAWAGDFDSWDVCDQVTDLFAQTPDAFELATSWAARDEEFVKRAGFVIMCALAHKHSAATDPNQLGFLPIIEREATDERNFVKKAVNWALRQIGKRSAALNAAAIESAERGSDDERNFVKKAVNWAIRQIGKRNAALNSAAVATALRLRESGSRAARWVASDALRELQGDAVRRRLGL